MVPISEIQENEWDLSMNRYKEIVYEEMEYDAPDKIMDDIQQLDQERNELLKNLKALMSEV